MLRDQPGIGGLPDIKHIGVLVIFDIQHVAVRHLEGRNLLMRQSGELFRRHLPGNLFYRLSGNIDTVTPDMVANFLLREFQHHLVGSPDTPVVHDSEILILGNQAVTLVVRG